MCGSAREILVDQYVERRLTDLVGDAGKRLHTARSRNEQVTVDVRLWLRDSIARTKELLSALHASLALALGGRLEELRTLPNLLSALLKHRPRHNGWGLRRGDYGCGRMRVCK